MFLKNSVTEKLSGKNKIFTAAIAVQILLVILSVLVCIFIPANDVAMPLTSLKIYGDTQTVQQVTDSSILMKNPDGSLKTTIGGGEYELPFGSYQLVMDYDCGMSDYPGDDGVVAKSAVYGADRAVEIFTFKEEYINDGYPFWIDSFNKKVPVSFEIIYTGAADFEVKSISIEENTAYRFVCVAFLAVLFLILDIVASAIVSKGKNKGALVASVIIFTAVFASLPLFIHGIHLKHDDMFHFNRIWYMSEELSAGNFPVRMMSGLVNGYGYPNSIFYCDLFLYLPAILCLAGVSIQTAYKVYIIAVSAVTVSTAYLCFNTLSKDKNISLIGSAMYTLCGYRLINIYLRGAVGEYTAMAFFPLVVMGMYLIYTREKVTYKDWMPLAFGMSGIIMSHILSTEIVVIFLVIFCIFTLRKTFCKKTIAALSKAVVITALLCFWFVVPFMEFYLTQPINVGEIFEYIQKTGLSFKEYISFFAKGIPYENGAPVRETEFSLGGALIIAFAVSVFYMLKSFISKNGKKQMPAAKYMLLLTVIAIAFSSVHFPWDYIQSVAGETVGQFLGNVQFSWRYLAVASATIVSLAVIVLAEIKNMQPKAAKCILVLLAVSTFATGTYFYADLAKADAIWNHYSMTYNYSKYVGNGEYFILNTDKEKSTNNNPMVHSGDIVVDNMYKDKSKTYIECTNNGSETAVVSIPLYNYKYYKAADTENGAVFGISNGEDNRIAVNLPPDYSGTVMVEFCPPMHWHIAEAVSLVSAFAVAGWFVYQKRKEKKDK